MLGIPKYGTPTSQTFWGCDESDTGGVLGVLVDGVLYTGDTLDADNDYTGIVEVADLSPGSHTWQMALDGVASGSARTFQTLPDRGENFRFVVVADATGDCQGFGQVANEGARFGVTNGDHYYLDVAPNFTDKCSCGTLPEGASAVVYATVLDTYRCKHRCHLTLGMSRMNAFRAHPWVFNWHNHEFEVQPFQTTTVADNAGVKYQAAKKAADEYLFAGNPAGPADRDIYPDPIVYRDFIVGDVHFISFDHTSYGMQTGTAYSYFEGTVPDGAGGSNIGSQQLDWAAAAIAASTSKFIVLLTPAEPVHTGQSAVVGAQWDVLLTACDQKDATIVLFCGDTHQVLAELLGGTKCPTRPLLVVNGTPLEHPLRSTASAQWVTAGDGEIYISDLAEPTGGIEDLSTGYNYNYVSVDVCPNGSSEYAGSHLSIKIKNALTGTPRWSCIVPEGEREPILPNTAASGVPR